MDKKKKTKLVCSSAIIATTAALGGIVLRKYINTYEKNLKSNKFVTGRIRRFGTLYLNGEKHKRPIDFINFRDIPKYNGGKIEIGDTDKDEFNKLSWVEINENNKKFLICDRNILKEISWNQLNEQNLVYGKVIVIEGHKYILRLLKGGNNRKSVNESEWNNYIVNTDEIMGLPVSNEIDKVEVKDNISLEKQNGENNELWHWCGFCSFTQDTYLKKEKFCIIRGFYANTYLNYVDKGSYYKTVGYRPVLELIE